MGSTSTLLAKRIVFNSIRFDESIVGPDDWDFYINLLKANFRLTFINEVLVLFFEDHDRERITTRVQTMSLDELLALNWIYDKHRDIFTSSRAKYGKASELLSYIGKRKNKIKFIINVIKEAGLWPFLQYFFKNYKGAYLTTVLCCTP